MLISIACDLFATYLSSRIWDQTGISYPPSSSCYLSGFEFNIDFLLPFDR